MSTYSELLRCTQDFIASASLSLLAPEAFESDATQFSITVQQLVRKSATEFMAACSITRLVGSSRARSLARDFADMTQTFAYASPSVRGAEDMNEVPVMVDMMRAKLRRLHETAEHLEVEIRSDIGSDSTRSTASAAADLLSRLVEG